jgi:hypothetical protein
MIGFGDAKRQVFNRIGASNAHWITVSKKDTLILTEAAAAEI